MSLHFHFHLGDLAAAFIQSFLQPFIHTFTHRRRSQPLRVTASSSGAVRVRRLAQRHLNTQLGGAWDRTSYIKGSTIYDVHQTVQQIETNPQRLLPALPMQFRRPAEKGMYAYGGLPTEFSGRKRSGWNSSGLGK